MDKELLYRFFRNEVSQEEAFAVQEWMESSEEAREAFFAERRLFDTLILGVEPAEKGHLLSLRLLARYAIQAADVLLIAVAGAWIWSVVAPRPDVSDNVITVAEGQRAQLILSDGTLVWLNAGSTMRYPASFGSDRRTVRLDGEGYFEVSRNEKVPFVVETSKADVEVLGTKFNIEAYASGTRFETALIEGCVRVRSVNGENSVVLNPHQKAVLTEQGFKVTEFSDLNPYLWRNGIIYFRDASFDEIIGKLAQYFNVEIIIRNEELLKRNYTGKFRQVDGLDYALEVLQRDVSFTVQHDEENRRLTIE